MTRTARKFGFLALSAALCAAGAYGVYVAHTGRPSVAEVRSQTQGRPPASSPRARYGKPAVLATLEGGDVKESSGLAASRRNPGLFWTHNDSGGGPYLYAFDRAGRRRGVWLVEGAEARDWEDIAAGPGPEPGRSYLYVGDTGDNGGRRAEVVVYRVAEPEVSAADAESSRKSPGRTEAAEAIRMKYPDGAHDAEALLVHPRTGDLYVVTKSVVGPAGVYRLAAPDAASKGVGALKRVAEVSLPGLFGGFITGGDISPDGRRVVLCDYLGAYEFAAPDERGGGFDAVWKQEPLAVDLGPRAQGEAVCYGADGEAVYATSERSPVPLIEVRREK